MEEMVPFAIARMSKTFRIKELQGAEESQEMAFQMGAPLSAKPRSRTVPSV